MSSYQYKLEELFNNFGVAAPLAIAIGCLLIIVILAMEIMERRGKRSK